MFFLIKDQKMRCTVLHGRCRNGLYQIPYLDSSSIKLCFSTTKISNDQLHDRLGHPSFKVVSVSNNSASHVCDAYQQAKSHQLPFSRSTSVSTTPLQVVFSDVWGPALALLATIIIMLFY
jgi:hypothetical protein